MTKAMTSGEAKKSGAPKKAPKVKPPSKAAPNYMKEADTKLRLKSKMWPLKQKRLSK
jgi:curved DNA-binding protein CbpA